MWCADDRKQALTVAKATGNIESRQCPNPVAEHMKLGEEMGVSGTPTILLEDGARFPGYAPPDRLIKVLEQNKQARKG